MRHEIKISVEVPDLHNPGQTKIVFSLVKVVDDSIDFDFRSVLYSLTVLFQDQFLSSFFRFYNPLSII